MVRTAAMFIVGGLIGGVAMLWLDDAGRSTTGADARGADAGLAADREAAAAALAELEQVATGDPDVALDEALAIGDPVLGRRAIVADFDQSSIKPTPPIAGVGRIAEPPPVALLSL